MTYAEERAAEIQRMVDRSMANPTNMGSTMPGMGSAGVSNDDYLRYLLGLYNANTQGNIADLQGRYGLEDTRLQNSGALDRANIGRDIARFQDQGQTYRTGLSEQGATQRSVFDNQGADYRAGLNLAGQTYAPALQSDRFGHVANNFVSPILQTLLGIQPGSAFQTRDMPTGGPPPSYGQGGGGQFIQPPPNYAPQGGGGGMSPPPMTQMAPVTAGGGGAQAGGQIQPSTISRTISRNPMQSRGMTQQPQRPQTPQMGQMPRMQAPSMGQQPAVNRGPMAPRMPTQQPQGQQPQRYAQATQSQPLGVMQPLPTQVGGPQITQGPVMRESDMQGLVNRQQGFNAARNAGSDRTAERATAAAGFGSNSPQLMALKNQNSIARGFADQDAAVTIPAQYRTQNAQHRLATENAASNAYGNRIQEELARRGQQSSFTSNLLAQILGLA